MMEVGGFHRITDKHVCIATYTGVGKGVGKAS